VEKDGVKVFIDSYTLNLLPDVEIDYVENDFTEGFLLKGLKGGCCS
jgi:Fe-S cluster assembly iron-binding protein IscA